MSTLKEVNKKYNVPYKGFKTFRTRPKYNRPALFEMTRPHYYQRSDGAIVYLAEIVYKPPFPTRISNY